MTKEAVRYALLVVKPKRKLLCSLLLAAILCSYSMEAAEESAYSIRIDTDEVRIVFSASDTQGHVIKTVRASDVAVADNEWIIRAFRSFNPLSQTPLDLVILLDDSESMEVQVPSEISNVKTFLKDSTWGERDRISILAFSGLHPRTICLENCNTQSAQVSMSTLRAGGSTPLYDALVQATEILKKNREPEYRPAIILFSDGVDTISRYSANDALQAAQNLQAPIYTVSPCSKAAVPSKGDAILAYLAVNTGGLSFSPGRDVNEILHMILEDLHGGYELTYELPKKTHGQHSVRVVPTGDPLLRFRSRQAYDDLGDR